MIRRLLRALWRILTTSRCIYDEPGCTGAQCEGCRLDGMTP